MVAVLHRVNTANLIWPLDIETDADREWLLFPEKQEQVSFRRMSNFDSISKELTRIPPPLCCSGWRNAKSSASWAKPFIYSQFCYHFHEFDALERATMHIHRKPGDQIEVDWAGDKLFIVYRKAGLKNVPR